ncbi:MAG: patatin-like phospholipase family protein [Bacteroidales bacterium]|nr:patatin-like phospholipase family protein [Bacteroidales bacterium]
MKRILLFLAACFVLVNAQAQNKTKIVKVTPPRPKVGVVLGGGGAKGAAHIGVLKYLEEVGIPVDYVAGTSMGSIIGGLYAMGYSPDELAELIADMDWSQYVGNSMDRSAMSEESRQRYSTMVVNIPFSLDGLLYKSENSTPVSFLPSAYVNNTALINLFNNLCVGYQKEMDFNDLPIPFACVATDIRTGKEVVIRQGSVPTAMRASMAIPGVFTPVYMNGRLLVDGGLVNNFPADVLKDMGADIIIGVEVPDKVSDKNDDKSVSLPDVLSKLIDNAVSSKRKENREICNIYIAPDMSGYGTLSFSHDAIDTLVNRGYKKAQEYQEPMMQVKHYLDSVQGAPLSKTLRAIKAKNLADAPVYVNSIVINQSGKPQTEWLLNKGNLKVGELISETDINRAVDVYRGTGAFDDITYNLTENEQDTLDSYTLTMNFKPTQPHIVGLGIRYDTEEGAAMLFNISLNEKRLTGYKLSLNAKLSYNPRINITGTYSSLNLANFKVAYDYRSQHFKSKGFDGNVSSINYVQNKVSTYVSQFHWLNINSAIGISYMVTSFDEAGLFNYTNDTISPDLSTISHFQSNHLLSPFIKISFDNLDDPYFARHGIKTSLTGHINMDLLGSANTAQDVGFSFQGYITPSKGRLTIIPQLYSRCVFNKPVYYNLWNTVGGEIAERHTENQMPFVGVAHVNEAPDFTSIARLDLRYNFFGRHYLTATYNFLYGLDPFDLLRGHNSAVHYSGIGVRYAYDSFIGPISFTTQWSNSTKQVSSYLSIGYTF